MSEDSQHTEGESSLDPGFRRPRLKVLQRGVDGLLRPYGPYETMF